MKDKAIKNHNKKVWKRIAVLISCVLFGQQLTAQSFNDFAIPAELIKVNRVRSIKQEFTNGWSDCKLLRNRFTYNNFGQIEQVEFTFDKEPKGYVFYQYDSLGRMVERIQRAMDSATQYMFYNDLMEPTDETKWEYKYDSITQMLKYVIHQSKKGIYKIDSVFYNPNMVLSTSFKSNGKSYATEIMYYDKYNNLLSKQHVVPDIKSLPLYTTMYTNKYDKKNQLIKSILKSGYGPVQHDYEYFDNGLLKSKKCKKSGESFILIYQVY